MKRMSEMVGLLAAMALFLGTLIAAEAYVDRDAPVQTAALIQTAQ